VTFTDRRPPTLVLPIVMHVGMVLLLAASATRYFTRHGWGDNAPIIVLLSGFILVSYLVGVYRSFRGTQAIVWLATVVVSWSVLTLIAPSFVWCSFPLFFVCLRNLESRIGLFALSAITTVAIASQLRLADPPDASLIIGPVTVALLTAATYRALLDETRTRERLIADLISTRTALAEQEREVGASVERQRLAGEIHDTIAQGLASSLLLLQAAKEQGMVGEALAHRYLDPAIALNRDNLAEARRFVRALAPAILDGRSLPEAIDRHCESTQTAAGVPITFSLIGQEIPMEAEQETALLRFVQGALANVAMHAHAKQTVVTLSYLSDGATIDVYDDGVGFDPARKPAVTEGTGFGLRSIRQRMEAISGTFSVESAPGDGTALAGWIPYRNAARSATVGQ
jgi:signal transduction histidine kinase